MSMSEIEQRLAQAGIQLPEPVKPVANYVPFTRYGNIVHVAGQLSTSPIESIKGIVGEDVGLEQAIRGARLCGINLIAQFKAACGGNLDTLKQVLKLNAFVQAGSNFLDIPKVANGCSDLMVEIFGERGRHARSAVGVFRLPLGFAVEIDAVIEIK